MQVTEDNFLAWREVMKILGSGIKTRPEIKKIGKDNISITSDIIDKANKELKKSTIALNLRKDAR
jgi:hypothetical protein